MKKKDQIVNALKKHFHFIRTRCAETYLLLRTKAIENYKAFTAWHGSLEKKKQNRVTVLIIALVIIGDYLMICYHTGKNPIAIFPSIPVLDFRDKIDIYIPSPDGKLLKESRFVQKDVESEVFIEKLTGFVIEGSSFENTHALTPIQGSVRKVWIHDGECDIDMRIEVLEPDAPEVAGAEKLFREALEKTITANVKGIRKVIVLENGIPDKRLWDTGAL